MLPWKWNILIEFIIIIINTLMYDDIKCLVNSTIPGVHEKGDNLKFYKETFNCLPW